MDIEKNTIKRINDQLKENGLNCRLIYKFRLVGDNLDHDFKKILKDFQDGKEYAKTLFSILATHNLELFTQLLEGEPKANKYKNTITLTIEVSFNEPPQNEHDFSIYDCVNSEAGFAIEGIHNEIQNYLGLNFDYEVKLLEGGF